MRPNAQVEVSRNRATPSHHPIHPLIDGVFHEINHPFWGSIPCMKTHPSARPLPGHGHGQLGPSGGTTSHRPNPRRSRSRVDRWSPLARGTRRRCRASLAEGPKVHLTGDVRRAEAPNMMIHGWIRVKNYGKTANYLW